MVLYAFGSNGENQLGLGHHRDTDSPSNCTLIDSDLDYSASNSITKIVAGGNHTLILDKSGWLYGCGDFEPLTDSAAPFPSKNGMRKLGTGIKDCSATWQTITLLTHDGTIATYGLGNKGELGRGIETVSYKYSISQGPIDMSPYLHNRGSYVSVASGLQHTIAVMSSGEVIGWGNGRKGQLGQPAEVVWGPRKIEGVPFRVIRAVCGREFTLLAGDPSEGQYVIFGSDKWSVRSNGPDNIVGWKDVGSNWASIFVLFHNGKLTSWGRNDHKQLADADVPPIEQMATGSEHTLAVTKSGDVLAWGWGEHGNCGLSEVSSESRHNFNTVPFALDEEVCGVGAGCATSWFWTGKRGSVVAR